MRDESILGTPGAEAPFPGTALTPASAAAGPGQPAAALARLPARPVHPTLHAVPRAREVPAAHPLPAGCLLHHFHAALCYFQRLPGIPHHVPGAQVRGTAGRAWEWGGGLAL